MSTEEDLRLTDLARKAKGDLFLDADTRHRRFFDDEMEKLDRWADDLKVAQREIKDLDVAIRDAKREARQEPDLATKVEKHRRQKALETERAEKRRALFEAQDEVDGKKETLLTEIESRMQKRVTETLLFTIRWAVL